MQPIDLIERVKTTYKSYIKTAFPVIDDDLRAQMHTLIEQDNLLWRGPYLSLQRPYERSARALGELQTQLGLHPKLLAEVMSFKLASATAGEVEQDPAKSHALKLSDTGLREIAQQVGQLAVEKRIAWQPQIAEVAAPVETIATGVDGTTMPLVGEDYKEAMCGTIALYDEEGTIWVLDFFHAALHLHRAAELIFGAGKQAEAYYEDWRARLLEETDAVSRMLRSLLRYRNQTGLSARIQRGLDIEINYFRENAERMRYAEFLAEGFPIGSGVTEAACKELIKARFCRSGMRWKRESGAPILQLRAIKLSHQWDSCN